MLIGHDLNYVLFPFSWIVVVVFWVIVALASSFPLFEDSSKNEKKKQQLWLCSQISQCWNVRLMNKDEVRETSTCQSDRENQ